MRNLFNTIIFFFFVTIVLWASCQDDAPKQTPINTDFFEPIKKTYQFEFAKLSGGGIDCKEGTLAWFKNKEELYHMIKYKYDPSRGVFDITYNDYVITSIAASTLGESADKGFIKIDSNIVTIIRHSDKLEIQTDLVKFYGFDNNKCVEVKVAQFEQ